ncbi:uncharacterized protein LOC132309673 [Cornus florida]|uniref:uncharacterized protein LOC132309673 n=1 Tax=Cornus florida TaxID=4283 RepID=UPI002899BA4A|nr:uncharacterized protein LOC132309673 [Cornus florida]
MDEQPENKNIALPHINLEGVKNSTTSLSSAPSSPMTLRKSPSMKQNCLCSPTTHAGSFRCRYHRNPSLSRSSGSIGSKLSELVAGPKLSEFESKPSRMCDLSAE